MIGILLHIVIGVLPVLGFLAALLYLDSYKLVTMRVVISVVGAGFVVAIACYFVNAYALSVTGIDFKHYSRYIGPLIEEFGKGLVIVVLIRMHRVGFLVDALDRAQPFDHLEPETRPHPQSERRAVGDGERLEVHLVREDRLGVARLAEIQRLVEMVLAGAVQPIRMQDEVARQRQRTARIKDRRHRQPFPGRDG